MRVEGIRGGIYLITVLDVSKSGLRINCSTSLTTGTRVEVRCRGASVPGEIRYARDVGQNEFHLGVEATSEMDLTQLFQIGH